MSSKMRVLLTVLAIFSICQAVCGQPWGGGGVEGDPYLIYTAEDMQAIGADANYWDAHFILVNDVNLADYTGTQFNIIGISEANAFTGVFDGNYHTISNFTYADEFRYVLGLFGTLNDPNALIKNLTLTNPIIDFGYPPEGVGTLVGAMYNGEVSNCAVEGEQIGWVNNVLYKDIEGTKGRCYYHRPDHNVRFFFSNYKVKAMYITRSDYNVG